MAWKNNIMSVLVFLNDALSNIFKEIKKQGGHAQMLYDALCDEGKVTEIVKIIVGTKLFSGNEYLEPRPDMKVKIEACDGLALISESSHKFSRTDYDFTKLGINERGWATKETEPDFYELVKDSDFLDLFNSVGVHFSKMCFTQEQIIKFAVEYKKKNETEKCEIFLLFKNERKYFLTALCFFDENVVTVYMRDLKEKCVLHADHKKFFILPQLEV